MRGLFDLVVGMTMLKVKHNLCSRTKEIKTTALSIFKIYIYI